MTYFPVGMSSDNRWRKGLTPLRLQNWQAEPLSSGANKPTKVTLVPTPGRTARVDLEETITGIFAENGVRNGLLHAVAGTTLYAIDSDWAATEIGDVAGSGETCFAGLRDKLFLARGAKPWQWNGSALAQVTDVDCPDITSMIVLAQRILAVEANSDTLSWSATLDGTDWAALGFSTAEQRPDVAYAIARVSGQALVNGATTLEIHRATGNSALPFANVTGQSIEESGGILGPRAWALSGDKVFLIGGNNAPYMFTGFSLAPLPANGELEDELEALSAANRLLVNCFSFRRGTHDHFVVQLPGLPAFVLDAATGLWHRRATFDEDVWLPRYYAKAYGKHIVADAGGTEILTLDEDVYTDAGEPIERIATLRVGFGEPESVGSMCLDLQAFDRPLEGLGSNPKVMIDISGDGRSQSSDSRSEIELELGADGKFIKPVLWGLGDFSPGEGATITIRLTDPVGMTLNGAWLNEGQV